MDGDVAADLADAEAAIARLDIEATSLVDTEVLARILLRAESVASSRIEGLEIGARRLLRAEAARALGEDPSDITAVEVLGNIDAMVFGIDHVGAGDPITVELLLEVHRRLLARTGLEEHGGRLRDQQNWIGGSAYNPCSAAFVPLPARDRESHDRERPSSRSHDDSRGSVYERGPYERREPREGERLPRHGSGGELLLMACASPT